MTKIIDIRQALAGVAAANGQLLTPKLDKVFDATLNFFGQAGRILISRQLSEPANLGVDPGLRVAVKPENGIDTVFHRTEVFRAI